MSLLGDDGRGYELARKLEGQGIWRSWLGDPLYANFVHYLSSPSTWETFMRTDDSKSRAQIQLQLRARALLFDKASSVSIPIPSNLTSTAIAKLNPNYLKLHGDDLYFTLENSAQPVAVNSAAPPKVQSKTSFGVGSRYGDSEVDTISQRFRLEEFPETWYSQFFERYKTSKPYRLSFGDRETDKRTPEQMFTYIRALEKHKRRRLVFREDQKSGPNMRSNSVLDETNAIDDETPFFPETLFSSNSVPESALPPFDRVEFKQKVEFNGVLDSLPQIMTRSPIMIERFGIRPEYLNMEHQGSQNRSKNGYDGSRRTFSQQQASEMSRKVIARLLANVGFEAASEVPVEVFSQLLSCHISKLGRILKVLADSYKKQCSAMELLKMFLQTTGHSNLGDLADLVKDNTKSHVQVQQNQQSQQGQQNQQVQAIQMQLQSQQQNPMQQSHQVPRQIHPQMQQMVHPQNLAFQQQQQWERMRRRQTPTPRPIMNMNMNMDKERPLVQVKLENPSDFPMDNNNAFTTNSRHPQMQFRQQQQQFAAMSALQGQTGNQFRQLASLQVPQIQAQVTSPNMGMVRARPVKVEGFQELMGGDSSLKHDSEENKLTSPK